MMIRIIDGGMFTTVQDRGRSGYMKSGVTVSGAMDERSYEIANLLVGNRNGEAALETTIIGPQIEFAGHCVFAVTGGDLQPRRNGEDIPMYRALRAKPGDILSFAGRRSGCRTYIAFQGGLDVPLVLGSRSTDVKAGLGGWQGRKLKSGDKIPVAAAGKRTCTAAVPQEDFSGKEKVLRVTMGPQEERFTAEGIATFLNTSYTVTPQSDRMGCRLSGDPIRTVSGSDIITDGICMGAVQVPADGKPIVMLADRQPTGGYAKIANVISVDLPVAAQMVPGDVVRFQKVTVQEAQKLLLKQRNQLRSISSNTAVNEPRRYRVTVDGQVYDIVLECLA